jgi:2-keto-4-pentenoate hydratase/2-oxohepta-3-ene-1,7-dioic acid hydratase in catechol pathway
LYYCGFDNKFIYEEAKMKLLNFCTQSNPRFRLGVKVPEGILDVSMAGKPGVPVGILDVSNAGKPGVPATVDDLLAAGESGLEALRAVIEQAPAEWLVDESQVVYGPCVPNPGKIICIGLNYRQHALESGLAVPTTPVLFSKFNNALAACGEQVPLASNAEQYDYEVELVVVIGKGGRYIPQDEALEHVFGYCTGNDLSARDLQMRTSQWLLGKTPDKFMPIGPYLVTADEAGDPQDKTVRCWLNGELRQNSNTADMVFSVVELISYISQFMTLEPGDIITTGTPQGVILGMAEKVWLKPGDEVVVEVEGMGRLVNRMVHEG